MLNKLLNYTQIYNLWINKGSTKEAAVELTLQQMDALEMIIEDDVSWKRLLEITDRGRRNDAWLASDWPSGFDELVLCVPLCKLVDWNCAACTIGSRQENNSCSHDYSLFGYIGELAVAGRRAELIAQIENARKMLYNENYSWNIHKCELEIRV
ncbi:MAG: hypothetical protein IT281_02040 [Ignavibacteria bacterium]|nr:hypothetical protein [Ignavibacteria bacterium]MCC7158300.1 hypothetical protein [Ignavibacteria bacterium]